MILQRLQSAWNRHTPASFARLVVMNLRHYGAELLLGRLYRRPALSEFDLAYGVDTEEIREVGSLDIDSGNARHAVRYQPSSGEEATRIVHSLAIEHSRFTFLDFGAGKGRVLLIAAQLPFAAVIGIEFSRELCQVASENIGRLTADHRRAGRIECHFGDATAHELPLTPLVCYFYNPFDDVVMRQVVQRLERSLCEHPRDAYIIYLHPEHRLLFDASGHWDAITDTSGYVTYRARAPQGR